MVRGLSQAVGVALLLAGVAAEICAVFHERMMHRHRRPGVSYWSATWRRDGGWRRADLFDEEGLDRQRRASTWGVAGIVLILSGLAIIVLGARFF